MLLYVILFYTRIIVLAFISVSIEQYPVIQLGIMVYLNLAIIAVLGLGRPYVFRRVNKFEFAGETLNLFYTNLYLFQLDVSIGMDARNILGWVMISTLSSTVLAGALRLLLQACRRSTRWLKRRCCKAKDKPKQGIKV